MKNTVVILACLFSQLIFYQKIFSTKDTYSADVILFVVRNEYQADLKVYKTKNQFQSNWTRTVRSHHRKDCSWNN